MKDMIKELKENEVKVLCGELGKKLSENLKKETSRMKSVYQSYENLIQFDMEKCLSKSISGLLSFLKSICKYDGNNTKQKYQTAKLI